MIGTMMVGNVLMLIIPGQRKMVEAMTAGRVPDAIHGQKAKQRSVHNNYFTLPVLFIMISNHYAMTYRHEHAWLVLAVIMAAGVLIRHFFNLRHRGRTEWRYPVAGVLLLFGVAVALAPTPPVPVVQGAQIADPAVQFAKVQVVMQNRCVACHAAKPIQAGFAAAPAGVMLESADQIRQHAQRIYTQAVQLKAMPIANMTNMTEPERQLIAAWFDSGAK
jgi:uncharacterized membrane protein